MATSSSYFDYYDDLDISQSSLDSLNQFIKSTISIKSHDKDVYVGDLHINNTQCELITLNNAKVNGQFRGTINVYYDDVASWEIIKVWKDVSKHEDNEVTTEQVNRDVDKKVMVPKDIDEDDAGSDSCYEIEGIPQIEPLTLEEEDVWTVDSNSLALPASNKLHFFNSIKDVSFTSSITKLSSSSSLGFSLFGNKISNMLDPDFRLDLFVFAQQDGVFAFHSKEEIVQELKPILESIRVEKVIHSCRNVSAILYKLYRIKLDNVSDTQIYDYYTQKWNHELKILRSPGYLQPLKLQLRSLDDCVKGYLNVKILPNENMDYHNALTSHTPGASRAINLIRSRVILLRELAAILYAKFVEAPFLATKHSLESLRDANQLEYEYVNNDKTRRFIISNALSMDNKQLDETQLRRINETRPTCIHEMLKSLDFTK